MAMAYLCNVSAKDLEEFNYDKVLSQVTESKSDNYFSRNYKLEIQKLYIGNNSINIVNCFYYIKFRIIGVYLPYRIR